MTTNNVLVAVLDGLYNTQLKFPTLCKGMWREYQAQIKAYHEDQNRLQDIFKADLLEEHGVTNNPKANLCYSKAWEMGHSAGLGEVANYFGDLVELIK